MVLLVLRNMSGAEEWQETWEFTIPELFEDTLARHAFGEPEVSACAFCADCD